ncbi:MAG: CHAD domain-containing protein [Leptospiraceae bacterium]|nr:CHAD domain-containing protein [Leptospiraceae bacterium]
MVTVNEQSVSLFGVASTLKYLEQLTKEIGGLREGSDIEYLHRIRVASRRVRRNMEVFHEYFPVKQWKKHKKIIKLITRNLGYARDLDVQIAFLQNFQANLKKKKLKKGIKYLTIRLEQKRLQEQTKILKTLSKIEKPLDEFSDFLKSFTQKANEITIEQSKVSQQARIRIRTLVDAVNSFDEFVYQPEKTEELHEMRIAFKFLRYEMEIFESAYGERYTEILTFIKDCQEFLGNLHDADVWLEYIPIFIESEEKLTRECCKRNKRFKKIKKGLLFLVKDRKFFRDENYSKFRAYWDDLKEQNIFVELKGL